MQRKLSFAIATAPLFLLSLLAERCAVNIALRVQVSAQKPHSRVPDTQKSRILTVAAPAETAVKHSETNSAAAGAPQVIPLGAAVAPKTGKSQSEDPKAMSHINVDEVLPLQEAKTDTGLMKFEPRMLQNKSASSSRSSRSLGGILRGLAVVGLVGLSLLVGDKGTVFDLSEDGIAERSVRQEVMADFTGQPLPPNFDSRLAFPRCKDVIGHITLQKGPSCVANAVVRSLSDAMCVTSGGVYGSDIGDSYHIKSVHSESVDPLSFTFEHISGLKGGRNPSLAMMIAFNDDRTVSYPRALPQTVEMLPWRESLNELIRAAFGKARRPLPPVIGAGMPEVSIGEYFASGWTAYGNQLGHYVAPKEECYTLMKEKIREFGSIVVTGWGASYMWKVLYHLKWHSKRIFAQSALSDGDESSWRTRISDAVFTNGHTMRLIGWGESKACQLVSPNSNSAPTYASRPCSYWLVANSWGRHWGDGGVGMVEMDALKIGGMSGVFYPKSIAKPAWATTSTATVEEVHDSDERSRLSVDQSRLAEDVVEMS